MPKRLELLSELVPQAKVIALLVNPNDPVTERIIRDVQDAARAKGVELPILRARTEGEIDTAFATLIQLHAGALVVGNDPFFNSRRNQLVALASRHAVPAIAAFREFAAAGGSDAAGIDFGRGHGREHPASGGNCAAIRPTHRLPRRHRMRRDHRFAFGCRGFPRFVLAVLRGYVFRRRLSSRGAVVSFRRC
jgi:hypothetical protein